MDIQVSFKINEKLFLKDPESSELGKAIIKNAIDLIYELGYEHFTFKKLANRIHTTEATVYRYFANKNRLLIYILNWYWTYLEYLISLERQKTNEPGDQLRAIIRLLTHQLPESSGFLDYNKKYLNVIAITESRKAYFIKEVQEINAQEAYKPLKDLCHRMAEVIAAYNPDYAHPHSLSSTLIETAQDQQFFSTHLPRLTDIGRKGESDFTEHFLEDLVFKVIRK